MFGEIQTEQENPNDEFSPQEASSVCNVSVVVFLSVVAIHAAAQNGSQSAQPTQVVTNDELQKLYLSLPIAKMATPRTADSHPDLSGVWLNPFPAVSEKNEDGSVRFDIGIAQNPAARPRKYPSTHRPSYKPEYAAKVKAIVDSQYGASTPLDPEYDCKPMGVPRASMNAIQIVQTPKLDRDSLRVQFHRPDLSPHIYGRPAASKRSG